MTQDRRITDKLPGHPLQWDDNASPSAAPAAGQAGLAKVEPIAPLSEFTDGSIRNYPDFVEDILRLGTADKKTSRYIRKDIYDTIDTRVRNAVKAALASVAAPVAADTEQASEGYRRGYVEGMAEGARLATPDASERAQRSVLDLPGAIMNIQCRRADSTFASDADRLLYKEGHRDARHDAADLALERADELVALATPADAPIQQAKATLGDVWQTGGVHWDLFPGYLIDHREGDMISEEGLQFALAAMLKDADYLRVVAERATPADAGAGPTERDPRVIELAAKHLSRYGHEYLANELREVLARMSTPGAPVTASDLQIRKATDELSLPELAEQFAAVEKLGCDYVLSAKVCGKLFRAMTTAPAPVTAEPVATKEWLIDGSLLYRLENGRNCDEINVTMIGGSRDEFLRHCAATKLKSLIEADHFATPAPADRDAIRDQAQQWISVDEREPEDNQTVAILYWPYNNRENSQVAGAAEYVDGAFYTHEGDMHHWPSHWAPIPALPTQPAAISEQSMERAADAKGGQQ